MMLKLKYSINFIIVRTCLINIKFKINIAKFLELLYYKIRNVNIDWYLTILDKLIHIYCNYF